MSRKITIDEVTAAYIKTRDEIASINKQIDELKDLQKRREEWMQMYLEANKLKNVKTEAGTVYTLRKESITVGDWDTFYAWVKEHKHEDFLAHSAAKTSILEYMGKDRSEPIPPGLNYTVVRAVGVRK